MKKIYLFLIFCCFAYNSIAQTTTFTYTGAYQIYSVPAGVNLIGVDMWGGAGGYPCCPDPPPINAGRVQCTMNVTPSSILYVYVGGAGTNNANSGSPCPGGWNGGGLGAGSGPNGQGYAAGGGGETDIRTSTTGYSSSNVLVVAGGGGGGGDFNAQGGLGGGTTGGAGNSGACGGGQTGPSCSTGYALGSQGRGADANNYSIGGGGAGWWGGNAGVSLDGGGGGGSSYPPTPNSTVLAIVHTQGYSGANGNGQVTIKVLCSTAGVVTGNASICPGGTTTLSDPTGASGGLWSTSSSLVTVNSTSGLVTGVSAGTAIVTYNITNVCGGVSPTLVVTVNPIPSAITGAGAICNGATLSTLNDASSGGIWSVSSGATINPTSGQVTGVSPGTSTVTYTLTGGCSPATATITVNTQPGAITGSTPFCALTNLSLSDPNGGGSWSSSSPGIANFNSAGSGTVTGVSGGTATVTYTLPGNCFVTGLVTVNPIASISGATSICGGTSATLSDAVGGGVWSSSNLLVATIGTSSGVLTAVSNGTTTLTYRIASTGCSTSVLSSVSGTPHVYSMTGGGSYCSGTGGVHVGLNSSDTGVGYQLYAGTALVGARTIGTGSALDFGLVTAAGTLTVVANPGASCSTNMLGSETVVDNPLPTAFAVTGGGGYCSGGSGVHIGLSSSTPGVTYQLFNGSTPVGSPVLGTSFALDFGLVTTVSTNYKVVATNSTTGCTNNMAGSASVSIVSLPAVFDVTGGGGYCLGGIGVHVGLSSSSTGVNYQLYNGTIPVGTALAGTGSALDFGLITSSTPSTTFTVIATNPSTTCVNNMTGSAVVVVNPLPTSYSMTGGGPYCLGGTGVPVGLNGSVIGTNYQLYNGTSSVGSPVAGTGAALNFGLVTFLGSYTVQATNTSTGCSSNMFGSATVFTNPSVAVFTITGGGNYCASGAGVTIGLSGSALGTNYSLYNGLTLVNSANGTGAPFNFTGVESIPGSYTVIATNTVTACAGNMSGGAIVSVNPLPAVNNVTGGGNFCAGGSGVAIGLNGSVTGVSYQLYNGTTMVGSPFSGTGSPFNFPSLFNVPGSYSVVATTSSTGCTNNMNGSATVGINPVPTPYALTGGGGYCAGGSGRDVGLASSNIGINYTLSNSTTNVATVPGTGSPIDFGMQTVQGVYAVVAVNPSTNCNSAMSGTAAVTINPLPTQYSLTGGGSYCAGGVGQPVGLFSSATGVNYQLFNGTIAVGSPLAGSAGTALNFGLQTGVGNYTVTAINTLTACSSNMIGSDVISISPLPTVYAVTGGGVNCVGGAGALVGLGGSAVGINYQLMLGTTPVGSAVVGTNAAISFGLIPTSGTYTVIASNVTTSCSSNMSGSATITTLTSALPGLYAISGGGTYCAGSAGVHVGLSGSAIGFNYQLYNGTTPVGAPIPGVAASLDFGLQTATGTYTVVATNISTGCNRTMTGSATVVVRPLPATHSVTGGGNYCVSGSGVTIGLNGSDTGVNYQLYEGASPVGTAMAGTGSSFSFGRFTSTGSYSVVANSTAISCVSNMAGSAMVGTYPLPSVYNVIGGGSYCNSGTGADISLSRSSMGVSYQLYNYDTIAVGAPLPGTGLLIDFGLQTLAGPYIIVGTNTTTNCSNVMNDSATIVIAPLPTAYNVTGGGPYCAGGSGVAIGLNGSDVSTNYQLFNGLVSVGSPVHGTGAAISLGTHTVAGTYTILATNTATTCNNVMTGSAVISISALPTAYNLSAGGNYCSGGAGVPITLSASDPGISYRLYKGATAIDTAVIGTGSMLNFGNQTLAGSYTVVASDSGASCTNIMTGSAIININPLPTAYMVSGGGNYCASSPGAHILLSGSNSGNTYQLSLGGVAVGRPVSGTGFPLDFGPQTGAGTYRIIATHTVTSCTNMMSDSANVIVNPLPHKYTLVGLGSNYCAGGPGIDMSLSNSDAGVNYQLYNGSTLMGHPVPGIGGAPIDFGLQTIAGNYSVNAINPVTGCNDTMNFIASITVEPAPVVHSITGGGSYCIGAPGLNIGLSGSNRGMRYQLENATGPVGALVAGTGGAISFGAQTVNGTYNVVAMDTATGCTSSMSGPVSIVVNSLPTPYTILGGGNFCAGGTGVSVGLNNSSVGVNYQLMNSGVLTGPSLAGSGDSLNFGLQTGTGSYSVVATNTTTSCSGNMAGTVSVGIYPLPVPHTVTGGGNYCPGGTGVLVGLSKTDVGVSYQLYYGTSTASGFILGTGSSISFGLQTATGTYTVVAADGATGCTNNMSGSAFVVISTPPSVFSVIGGGNYCIGSAGSDIVLSGSVTGVSYTLYAGTSAVMTVAGTGGSIDFGLHTAGTYTVKAVDPVTGCSSNMTGSVVVTGIPVVVPSVTISTGRGDTLCSGTLATFVAVTVNGGSSASYQWMVNGVVTGAGNSFSYIPANGDMVSVTLTSSAVCAIPASAGSTIVLTVLNTETPSVNISPNPGDNVCQGTVVMFSASSSFGGSAPMYSWVINHAAYPPSSAATYTYVPNDGDIISCNMTSDYACASAATVSSNFVAMQVDSPIIPVVIIDAHPSAHITPGQLETLDATIVRGGGARPAYQWYVNGIAIPGATLPEYVNSNFNNNDSVTCEVVSSSACPNLDGFNSVIIYVHSGVGVQQIASGVADVKLIPNPNKGMFAVKGSVGSADEEVTMEITDLLGQVIYSSKFTAYNGEVDEQIQLGNNLANGMYLLSLRSSTMNAMFHMVIEQ